MFSELSETHDANRFLQLTPERYASLLPERCAGLDAEFASSRSHRVLARSCFFRLQRLLFGESPNQQASSQSPSMHKRSVLLEGRHLSGKSVLLACAVAWLREHGWMCMYLPDASSFTRLSDFKFNEAADMYDAPLASQRLIQQLAAPNVSFLSEAQTRLEHSEATREALRNASDHVQNCISVDGGDEEGLEAVSAGPSGSVLELAQVALSSEHEDGNDVTDICLDTFQELKSISGVPVLLAVDNINTLSWDTSFYEVPNDRGLSNIQAGEFRHVEAVRDMRSPPSNGAYLGVTSRNAGVNARRQVRQVPKGARRTVSRFDLLETTSALANYRHSGGSALGQLDEERARYLHMLSCGNPGELMHLMRFH
jgi:hypothetical protein